MSVRIKRRAWGLALTENQAEDQAVDDITGGEWIAGYNGDPVCIGTADGRFVAMTLTADEEIGTAEDYANAALIAASPELFKACEIVMKYLEANRPKGHIRDRGYFTALNEYENGVMKPLRAAIEKAKRRIG